MAATNQEYAQQKAIQHQQRRILRLPAVKSATGLGRSKIYNLMKEGRFPKARRIAGAHVVGWDSLEVEAWVSEQLECL
ncbi:AlpA family phage regulatory protein [Pseudomonas fluorescens]|uniref:AlpA family phage regulatory protein n=1 Tax=Pseudomonas fluorescens TaxID=294 RepID=UPI00058A6EBC|nr:AlpA family phage regulatory protein [Pseudomonas fluorescens]CEL31714.1 Prophage CP4-57 regulatory protein (AlpA) [Pseudomonas fluorescens]